MFFKINRIDIHKPSLVPRPGQFVFLCFPRMGITHWHPFSISTYYYNSEQDKNFFSVHIKASGDYTHQLVALAREDPQAIEGGGVRVEGPYGNLVVDPWAYNQVLIIAGTVVQALFSFFHIPTQLCF